MAATFSDVVFPLQVRSRINNSLKPIKRMIKVNKIKKQREEAMPGVNSAHMCLSAAAAVFSQAVRRKGTAKTVGMFNKWQKSTRPVQTWPISAQRRGSRKLSNTDISLATGFHQSQGRTTVTGTNLLCSLSLPLLVLWKKRKKRKTEKKVLPRYEVQWTT